MIQALSAAESVLTHDVAASSVHDGSDMNAVLPRQAHCLRDTGLEPRFVTALVVKTLHGGGKMPLSLLSGKLRLSVGVLREVLQQLIAVQQAEVAWSGETDLDVHYQLTGFGQRAAVDYLAESRYVGPAPVTLVAWRAVLARQSQRRHDGVRVSRGELQAVLQDDGLPAPIRELIGAALYSNRAVLLHGPCGSGKTTLARKFAQFDPDPVAVPYAVLVNHDIVQLHDPALHPAPMRLRTHEERRSTDARWALSQRPLVQVGAGLTHDMLALRPIPGSGVLRAPPHLLANSGTLVLDDLGRQSIPASELLHRWLDALETGQDYVAVPDAPGVTLPFDVRLVVATSMPLAAVLDEACLRRIGYQIPLGPLSEASYRALVRRQASLQRIECNESAIDYLVRELHGREGRALLATYPRELMGRIADFAGFSAQVARCDSTSLEWAWRSLFGATGLGAAGLGATGPGATTLATPEGEPQ